MSDSEAFLTIDDAEKAIHVLVDDRTTFDRIPSTVTEIEPPLKAGRCITKTFALPDGLRIIFEYWVEKPLEGER